MSVMMGDILVKYRADISNLSSGVKAVKSDMSSVGESAKKSGETISGSLKKSGDAAEHTSGGFKHLLERGLEFAAIDAGIMTVGGALGFLKDQTEEVVKVTEAHQLVAAQTNQVLKSTHDVSGMTATSLNDLADAFSQTTMFSHDTVQSGENMLLTFTNIGKNIFPQATQAVLDLSQGMHQDLQTSTIQVGKALNDPIAGLTNLSRIGVTFSTTQKEMIKNFMASGQQGKAQAVILQELTKEFGGSAAAAGKTFPGALQILKNTFEDLRIKIGTAVMPILTQFMQWFSKNGMPAISSFASFLTGTLIPGFLKIVSTGVAVVQFFQNLVTWFKQGSAPAIALGAALAAVAAGLLAMKIGQFIASLPALILRLGVWAAGQWAVAAATIATALPYILVAAVVAAVVIGIILAIQHWGAITKWLGDVWATVSGWIGARFSWLGGVAHVVTSAIGSAFSWLGGVAHAGGAAIGAVFDWIGTRIAIWLSAWRLVFQLAGAAFSQFGSFIQGIISAIGGAFSGLGSLISGVWNGIVGDIRQAINWIIGMINGFIGGIDSIGIDLGPIHIHPNIPQIPYLASGGYIQSTGIAVVHAGESVIPAHASAGGYGEHVTIIEIDSVVMARVVNKGTDRLVRLKLGAGGRAP